MKDEKITTEGINNIDPDAGPGADAPKEVLAQTKGEN